MSKVAVIGAGSWGTALAQVLCDSGNAPVLYAIDDAVVRDINENHRNTAFLGDVLLPESLRATGSLKDALDGAEFVLLAVPTAVSRVVLRELNEVLNSKVVIINASKGIEPGTHKRMSEIVRDEISDDVLKSFVALSGPSHAEEVIVRDLTSVTCAGNVKDDLIAVQELFTTGYFRVYWTLDLIGVEVGGSIKNVIALGSGVLSGLGFGDNAKASLITRGLVEIRRLGVALGANEETFFGLSGLGDLIVTAMSRHSRNFQAGVKIGSGTNLEETLDSMTMVVEGVRTCQATYELACALEIEMPIVEALYEIVFDRNDPREAIARLMKRESKGE